MIKVEGYTSSFMSELEGYKNILGVIMSGVVVDKVMKEFAFIYVPAQCLLFIEKVVQR